VLLLSLASTLSPFGMVTIIPTLGMMTITYGIDYGQVQFLVSAYLFGLGIAQPVAGTLSDRLGRRPVLLAGFAIFTLASVACMVLSNFALLVIMRFVQAIGVSVGTVTSRAVVRDTRDSLASAEAMARIGAAQGLAPIIGPVIGGGLGAVAGAPAVFATHGLLGLLIAAGLYRRLPETLQAPAVPTVATGGWRRHYVELLGSRVFMGYTLMYGFVSGCFFAFMAVAAAVFETDLGLGPGAFGMIWGLLGIIYVLGATGGARLTRRLGLRRALLIGSIMQLAAAWTLGVATVLSGVGLTTLLGPLTVLMAGAGILTPLSLAGAVNHRPDIAGTASGISSSLGLCLGGVFSIVAGFLYTGSFAPIALVMSACATLAAAMHLMSRP
jgi:DHA1 family bicyclomycin/chloramphenicol resistance-like MFS transporter